jgi:hypothetical protein
MVLGSVWLLPWSRRNWPYCQAMLPASRNGRENSNRLASSYCLYESWQKHTQAPHFRGEVVAMLQNIESLRQKVHRLNQVHAALLRRASYSLTILRNLIERNNVAYAPPSSLRSPASIGEGGGI